MYAVEPAEIVDAAAASLLAVGLWPMPSVDEENGASATRATPNASPKGNLFEWCSKTKVCVPVFMIASATTGFEGSAELTLPDRSKLSSGLHRAPGRKALEQTACAELLSLLRKILGPEMRPPSPPRKTKKSRGGGPDELAAARALAKEQARQKNEAILHRLLLSATPSNADETLQALKNRGHVRGVRIEVTAQRRRGALLIMQARCVRLDGSTVHVPPFEAPNRREGESVATEKILRSVAASIGVQLSAWS